LSFFLPSLLIFVVAGEFDFLNWVRQRAGNNPAVRIGVGDDLAVLNWPPGELVLVGVDQVLDGVHFDSAVHDPRAIGKKAMNRNLSDCAAMACLPVGALASVALPRGCGVEYARELYLGIEEAANRFNCAIVGGDTGSWPGPLAVTVSIFGRCGGIIPITRGNAKAGDFIYVSGPLGGSILSRHMTFEPRVGLARQIAAAFKISAMIDMSDGLSRDLKNICQASGVGAIVDTAAIPIHDDAVELARDGTSSLAHALHDGEDYELLLTSPAEIPNLHRIGVITEGNAVSLCTGDKLTPLDDHAWEHKL
jgi:thiamine-monophosphate kinase